ncbi:ribonuclease PH [uncultured Clostridium sp.]|jgi:ribonuclease PH|uniref:ribonuclease PH n=1 Tax=uncultured Clostridium sp. TaxID=59620 RepID=UPI002607D19F|nr:ribonuclease PH [uncultured Clostridium sp.]
MRDNKRRNNQVRPIKIERNYNKYAEGSVLISVGDTKVICTVTVEERVPQFLKNTGKGGWITAEYSMLPRSTHSRKQRDITRLKADGRSVEIQRLIGRALRSVVDLKALGDRTIVIDCDVIQADGGTRVASIVGSFVALVDALNKVHAHKNFKIYPIRSFVGAISVGVVNNQILVDLAYEEDSKAKVDMNLVMTDEGDFVEIQGTGEESPFSQKELSELLEQGYNGCKQMIQAQKDALKLDALRIGTGGQ